jgi:cellulose synthase/poly-beta-1,6-N-acetylglucosamine synthase-like glycosyltransferase
MRTFFWLGSFLCAAGYYGPPIFALVWAAPGPGVAVATTGFAICLLLFWGFAIYGVVNAAAGFKTRWFPEAAGKMIEFESGSLPKVVLLYPTRNDLREEAVAALRAVGGERCEVVICDDSTLVEWRGKVDALVHRAKVVADAEAGLNPVRVIRRPAGSAGWKAGNLNHALRELAGEGFDFFAVCDADGIFPENFLENGIRGFLTPESTENGATRMDGNKECVGLVQGRQEGDLGAGTGFSRGLAPAVGAHFRQQVAGRAGDGFVMFYGHGALISMEAWRAVGGLPEIVTEDLAFSMKLRVAGWRGVYADDMVCAEEFPLTWRQLRKRSDKWIRGTGECLRLHGGAFFQSKAVPWREKLDVLMHGTQHFLAVPMLIFLILLATVLPWGMKEFRLPGSFFLPPVPQGKTLVEAAMGLRYHVFWSWDFYLMMVLATLAPVLPMLLENVVRPGRRLKSQEHGRPACAPVVSDRVGEGYLKWSRVPGYFAAATFTFLAGLVADSLSALVFLITGKATFRTTNDAAEHLPAVPSTDGAALEKPTFLTRLAGFDPNHWSVFLLEAVVGSGFLMAMWVHKNLWFLGPGLALVLSPVVAWSKGG